MEICLCIFSDRAFIKYLGTITELKQKPVDQIPPEEGIIIQAPKTTVINSGSLDDQFSHRNSGLAPPTYFFFFNYFRISTRTAFGSGNYRYIR